MAVTTPAVTFSDIISMELEPDHESHEHTGNRRFKRVNIGNDATKLTLKTTDAAVQKNFYKDLIVAGVTAIWRSVDRSVDINGAASGAADYATFTCTSMRVVEAVKVAASGDGKAQEFDLVLEPCQTSAGADPVMTYVVAPPPPEPEGGN